MSTARPHPPVPLDDRLGRHFLILVHAVNRTPGHLRLYLLSGLVVLVIGATAVMQVRLNAWNEPFYDAISRKQVDVFLHQLLVFFGIAAVLLVLNVCQNGLNQLIRLKLRELATQDLISNWMSNKRAARITRAGEIGRNPDQRIHADTLHLADLTTDLALGLTQASVLLLSFIGVLWVLSSGIVLYWDGSQLVIPGYMVWAALLYALIGSWLSWMVGRPLVRLQSTQYAREADLRFSLLKGAEEADEIAINNVEAEAAWEFRSRLATLVSVIRRIVTARVRLTWVTAGYGWVALVVPIVVAAPGYFGGSLSFGELMVVVGAFNQVQQALRWFVDNTSAIADWRATLLRVMTFREALLELDQFEADIGRIERVPHPDGRLALDDVRIITAQGQSHLSEHHLDVSPGERVLIVGKPGAGKTTLFLALAGLWNCGTGRLSLPPPQGTMFLSEKPFLPDVTLRTLLTIGATGKFSDAELIETLHRVDLDQLAGSLDRKSHWARELTLREQERLVLARAVHVHPEWLICDEALDLVDETNRQAIESVFSKELADTTVIAISQVAPPGDFYTRTVRLIPQAVADEHPPDGPVLPVKAAPPVTPVRYVATPS
jgi:vitamin B12/bleomycin/antimicrobial peptide transport system ATP-binding/permease protein